MKIRIQAFVLDHNVGEKKDKQGNVRTYLTIYDRDEKSLVRLSAVAANEFKVEDGASGTLTGDLRQGTFEGRSFLVLKSPAFEKFKA